MQFLASGCRMNVVIGIDFTASNKCPADPTSLHYTHPDSTQLNPYEQVSIRHAARAPSRFLQQSPKNRRSSIHWLSLSRACEWALSLVGLSTSFGLYSGNCFDCFDSREV